MDVDVETPQRTAHDIRLQEPIGVWYSTPPAASAACGGDTASARAAVLPTAPPEVFALREDFPAEVPHVNLRTYDYPKSLCLYDVPFAELRATWTPGRLVALVRDWLRLTARGELHAADQPLEPLMFGGYGWIILPNILRERDAALGLERRGEISGLPVLAAVPPSDIDELEKRYIVAFARTAPRTHGVIRRAPASLADLHEMLADAGDDLLAQVAATVRGWKESGVSLDAQVALVVLVPMRRSDSATPEVDHPWAFLTAQTVSAIGESLGLWERSSHGLATLLGGAAAGDGGASVQLLPVHAYFAHRRIDAARYNGRSAADDRRFVAVGAGALGSQVLACFARSAFGRWSVIDGDVMLPHNLARHALPEPAVGFAKATAVVGGVMAAVASDGNVHSAIVANLLEPGSQQELLERSYTDAVAIVDMSASVAVARALARDATSAARRLSLFLSPSGSDLVLLAEDESRSAFLDALEMQYYRAVAGDPRLAGTLGGAVTRERYGRSCRDVSSQLPHARVALHAGVGAQAVERALSDPRATIRIWRLDEESLGVSAVDVRVHPVADVETGGWRVVTDAGLLARIAELRLGRLPNETGGVLLGAVDVSRRIVYIVDTIPSPPDSVEWPTLYIRGSVGLAAEVERVRDATAGQLHYIGEWHSHPRGYPALPSDDDLQVFVWITEALDADDLPAVMMIVGDEGSSIFVGASARGGCPARFPSPGALSGPDADAQLGRRPA